jgi:hypothetical protein
VDPYQEFSTCQFCVAAIAKKVDRNHDTTRDRLLALARLDRRLTPGPLAPA